ncbi:hypothetical protein PIIN_04982 [Serendipita indica DSM 11827]|uniref:Uncharacterized protein n=1 Tax=Serendipita indica (strain DSM 11827) TaxID=1109443 RepID=G4TIA4_SERID|nr:hypothetical protein PIIN_04982 [Serendipita indica DSM 11827]
MSKRSRLVGSSRYSLCSSGYKGKPPWRIHIQRSRFLRIVNIRIDNLDVLSPMSLLVAQLPMHLAAANVDSPAWLEVDRLRSRRRLLTNPTSSRAINADREQRRKRRQWERWTKAMDAALESLRKETQASLAKTTTSHVTSNAPPAPTCEPQLPAKLSLCTESVAALAEETKRTESFSSRSPTLYSPSPSLRSRRPVLKIKIDYVYEFSFVCPTGPVWPRSQSEALSSSRTMRPDSSSSAGFSQCAESDSFESLEVSEHIARGQRLLQRKRPAEQAQIRRKTLWTQRQRKALALPCC